MLYSNVTFYFRYPLQARRDARIVCVLIRAMDIAAVTAHNGCLSQLPTTTQELYVCVFLGCVIFSYYYFLRSQYYIIIDSVQWLFSASSREKPWTWRWVFYDICYYRHPTRFVARAFPRSLQGHLRMFLPLSISVDRSGYFGRPQLANLPKNRRV